MKPTRSKSLIAGVIFSLSLGCAAIWMQPEFGLDAALVLNRLGFYELGEAIYSLCGRTNDYSLAVIVSSECNDDDPDQLDDHRLNRGVALFYGAESPQMAKRYMVLATHLITNFSDYKGASKYFEKARHLYSRLGNSNRSFTALTQQVYSDFAQKHRSRFVSHLRMAAEMKLERCGNDETRRDLSILWSLAHRSSEPKLALHFLKLLDGKPVTVSGL